MTKTYEQQATTIRESINVDISEADKKVQIIFAKADADAIRIINNAKSSAINNTIFYEREAYDLASKKLMLNAKDGLIDYMTLMNIMKNQESQLLVGMKNTMINLHANTGGVTAGSG